MARVRRRKTVDRQKGRPEQKIKLDRHLIEYMGCQGIKINWVLGFIGHKEESRTEKERWVQR